MLQKTENSLATIEAEIAAIEKMDYHHCPAELRERHNFLCKKRMQLMPLASTLAMLGLA